MGCIISHLAAKFAFFPPTPPTYQLNKRDDGKLVAISTTLSIPIAIDDSSLDMLSIPTKRGNKIIAFYLRNPNARLTLLYTHGNAADLGQLYDLFVQLKANLRVNLIGSVQLYPILNFITLDHFRSGKKMSVIYDNWERLVAAVLKREEIWQLCHQHSRSPSICSESSDYDPSFRLSDVNLQKKEKSVPKPDTKVVFLGGYTPAFQPNDILRIVRELDKGTSDYTYVGRLTQDVQVSDQEFLASGTEVVLKALKEVKVTQEFKQQVNVIGNCRHENVDAPRAYYFVNKINGIIIVCDYHRQGSLSDMLHDGNGNGPNWGLNLEGRVKIAIGAARGIAHIHKQSGGKLAHGNIKSSNIFLNSQHYGCVSDFDLSGIKVKVKLPYRRALGYHAPEYNDLKTVSQEADVYSFGVLLLELLTGRSPMKAQGFERDLHLVSWARSVRSQDWNSKLFDQSLRRPLFCAEDVLEMMVTENSRFHSTARVPADYFAAQDLFEMREMLEVAMRCLSELVEDRPKMSDVVLMLENIGKPKTGPKQPQP